MLAMSNSVQSFIDAHVKAQTDEFACFMSQQVEKMIEDDPTGARADAYISYWYDTKRTPLAENKSISVPLHRQKQSPHHNQQAQYIKVTNSDLYIGRNDII